MKLNKILKIFTVLLPCFIIMALTQAQQFKKSIDKMPETDMEISSQTVHYKPAFGEGDNDSKKVMKAIKRFGLLAVDPKGKSKAMKYVREELVYYVLSGTGMLHYGNIDMPVSKDDFFYVPIGTTHSFSNPREDTLNVIVMGAEIPRDTIVKPTADLNLASANDVALQILPGSHGPSSKYQLLLGPTSSKRDRLASAYQINSLFIIDFDPGGTNIPHRHKSDEEIYFMLQGDGEMVAGDSADGKEMRYPASKGDAFFFPRNTLVGFYSNANPAKQHTRILAIRVKYPTL